MSTKFAPLIQGLTCECRHLPKHLDLALLNCASQFTKSAFSLELKHVEHKDELHPLNFCFYSFHDHFLCFFYREELQHNSYPIVSARDLVYSLLVNIKQLTSLLSNHVPLDGVSDDLLHFEFVLHSSTYRRGLKSRLP